MSNKDKMDNQELRENPALFLKSLQSLCMGSVDKQGRPHASYAPFGADSQHRLYVLLSGLASHSSNLFHSKMVSVMFIEDEATAGQLFARRRLTLDCSVELLDADHPHRSQGVELLVGRFGESVERMAGMPDFRLFRITPQGGKMVLGFGQAFEVSADLQVVEHQQGDGQGKAHGVRREL